MVSSVEKGLSPEGTGEKWAYKRQERLLYHVPPWAIRVIARENQPLLEYPLFAEELGRQADRPTALRIKPTGEIIVPRWREPLVLEDNGRRLLAHARNFDQILRPKEHHLDLEGVLYRPVAELLPMVGRKGIETAMRQQVHIIDRAQIGEEAAQVEAIMEWIKSQTKAVLEGKVSPESLEELAKETGLFLEESGLLRAKIESKRRIAQALTDATQLDSRGRFNSLAIRLRLRSAYLEAVRREILPVLIEEKFGSFLGLLLMEREYTRQTIKGIAGDLESLVGFPDRRKPVVFQGKREHAGERKGILTVLEAARKPLGTIRVRPYLLPTRVAAINLFGCREQQQQANRQIIGEERADRLFGLTPVVQLIARGHFQEARDRIVLGTIIPLEQILDEYKEIGIEDRHGRLFAS